MKLAPLALAALTTFTAVVAAPEAQASSRDRRCNQISSLYNYNARNIENLNLRAAHPLVQQQFVLRDEAQGLGCPVGPDTLEAEVQNGGVSGTVHNPAGTARTNAMASLCKKWEQANHIAAVNGKPNFGFRVFVGPNNKVTVIERKSETTCLKVVKGVKSSVTSVKNGNLYNGSTMFGARIDVATRLWGSNRNFHNTWTLGAGARFYN